MPKVDEKKLERYRKLFEECDTDKSHMVSFKELKMFLKTKKGAKNLPADQIKYIFKLADKDGDKIVNFDEFVDILEHPDLKHVFGHWMNSYVKFLVPQAKAPPKEPPPVRFVPKGRSIRMSRTDKEKIQPAEQVYLVTDEEDEIAYSDQLTCCPPPFAMVLLTVLELAFFLTDELTQKDSTLTGSGVTAQIFLYKPDKRHEAWRFLTYMFVHIGYFHIVVNALFQLALGIPLEMVHKWWRVSLLYFAGVIAGSLTTSITDPKVRLAGASGGVYSLLTAHIATIIMNWSEMANPVIQLLLFGIIVVGDTGNAIYDRFYSNKNNQVGFAAHFGGAVAGLLVGIYLLKNLQVTTCEKYLWWVAVFAYVVLMVTAILMNVLLPDRYPSNE